MYKFILIALLLSSVSAEYTIEYFYGTEGNPAFNENEGIT